MSPGSDGTGGDPDPLDVAIGLQVGRLRMEQGVSQQELGSALGLGASEINSYERGCSRLTASLLVKMARVLQAPASAMLPPNEALHQASATARILSDMRDVEQLTAAYTRIRSSELKAIVLKLLTALADADAEGQSSSQPVN